MLRGSYRARLTRIEGTAHELPIPATALKHLHPLKEEISSRADFFSCLFFTSQNGRRNLPWCVSSQSRLYTSPWPAQHRHGKQKHPANLARWPASEIQIAIRKTKYRLLGYGNCFHQFDGSAGRAVCWCEAAPLPLQRDAATAAPPRAGCYFIKSEFTCQSKCKNITFRLDRDKGCTGSGWCREAGLSRQW